ncbi:MAG: hypothetical protein QXP52_00230 [Candidatus Aenigmatarchaeota archaeon]
MNKEELLGFIKKEGKMKRSDIWFLCKSFYIGEELLEELYHEKKVKFITEGNVTYVIPISGEGK